MWHNSGLNVGQWTEECETWFKDHVSKIHSGDFQPCSSGSWRQKLKLTRISQTVKFKVKKAAASYISAIQSV